MNILEKAQEIKQEALSTLLGCIWAGLKIGAAVYTVTAIMRMDTMLNGDEGMISLQRCLLVGALLGTMGALMGFYSAIRFINRRR